MSKGRQWRPVTPATRGDAASKKISHFVGSRGSVYKLNDDGTYTRTKTAEMMAEQDERAARGEISKQRNNTRFATTVFVHPEWETEHSAKRPTFGFGTVGTFGNSLHHIESGNTVHVPQAFMQDGRPHVMIQHPEGAFKLINQKNKVTDFRMAFSPIKAEHVSRTPKPGWIPLEFDEKGLLGHQGHQVAEVHYTDGTSDSLGSR